MKDDKRGKTLVTIATYNEIENLPTLIDEIFQSAPQVDVLVIDDNSPDGTGQWCDRRAGEDDRVHCLHRPGKLGLGSATIAGMRYAMEHGYQQVLNMDADFSHDPKYLPDLLRGMGSDDGSSVDVMIGSRYVPGGGIRNWPLKRHLMSRGVNLYSRWLLGLKTKDCSGAYRCYRTSKLAEVNFDEFLSAGYAFQEEMLYRLKRVGCRFGETPIVFVDRVKGSSKIDQREARHALWVILRLGCRRLTGRG